METKIISINVKKIKEMKSLLESNRQILLSDAVKLFGQQIVGEFLASENKFKLVPDGGLIVCE